MQDTDRRRGSPAHSAAIPAARRAATQRGRGWRIWLVATCILVTATPALAQVTAAPPRHVPGPVAPSSGKAKATPATSPIPGPSTTGNATGPEGDGPAPAAGSGAPARPAPGLTGR
jgi:hypothetical protein